MPRFFVDKSAILSDKIAFEERNHLKALRLRIGDEIILCDGEKTDYLCRFTGTEGDFAIAEIIEVMSSRGEGDIKVTVFLAYAKGDRLDFAIQKCVELGAYEFCLFPSARVVALPDKKSIPKKLQRFNAISKSAAQQSGRGIIPRVFAADSFKDAVEMAAAKDLPILFYEEEIQRSLKDVFNGEKPSTISIMTGCEGGFTPDEAEFAISQGLISLSLGPRILRCDTAPIGALAAIMHITGNL